MLPASLLHQYRKHRLRRLQHKHDNLLSASRLCANELSSACVLKRPTDPAPSRDPLPAMVATALMKATGLTLEPGTLMKVLLVLVQGHAPHHP